MVPDYTVGERTSWCCQNQCGHREWTGAIGTLKRFESPSMRVRACQLCGKPLPARSHHQTRYHRHCREVIKRHAAKLYKIKRLERAK